ncbi:hypothetical protein H4F99_04410 [Lysobacter sp. SG-8]|uniref:Uncharacterized protein n=1 Tax=Marilutibacter penaei TaxID=2759900 RepID=A0A7W3U2J3_9GAMM|nr:hypothetical protein [Lysobacter penaei]MBB1087727.1 hypothetical protein [Lysobacter penaei]
MDRGDGRRELQTIAARHVMKITQVTVAKEEISLSTRPVDNAVHGVSAGGPNPAESSLHIILAKK